MLLKPSVTVRAMASTLASITPSRTLRQYPLGIVNSMIPKQAIEKAIAGGWRCNAIKWSLRDPKDEKESLKFTPASYQEMEKAKKYDHWKDWILGPVYDYGVVSQELPLIAIDPTFWQALGKATDRSDTKAPNYIMVNQCPDIFARLCVFIVLSSLVEILRHSGKNYSIQTKLTTYTIGDIHRKGLPKQKNGKPYRNKSTIPPIK